MKDKLTAIINDAAKVKKLQYHVKQDCALKEMVDASYGETYSEKVWNCMNPGEEHICAKGNRKKFKTVHTGYGFCGQSSICECAKASVKTKMKAASAARTQSEIDEINAKRDITNTAVYGVANIGQTAHAKEQHAAFYDNVDNVAAAIEKQKATKLERHGDANFNKSLQEVNHG